MILDIMESRRYVWDGDVISLLRGGGSLTMSFTSSIFHHKLSFRSKATKALGLKSFQALVFDQWAKTMRSVTDDYPYEVRFRILDNDMVQKESGIIVEIESEPMIVSKIRQLGKSSEMAESHYGDIIWRGRREVTEVIRSMGGRILTQPEVLRPREFPSTPPLIHTEFLETLPDDIKACLDEANRCFKINCNYACSMMLRKSIEVAASKKLRQMNKELYDGRYEIGLEKKLDVLGDLMPKIMKYVEEIKIVKWFGDIGAHDPRTPITADELQNVVPKLKAFLANLELRR
jgi:hypothetical protein